MLTFVLLVAFIVQLHSFTRHRPYLLSVGSRGTSKTTNLHMVFGGIAEKMGGIVELISGQTKITNENIEATLKEVRAVLIDADVNLQVANTLISKVKEKAVGMKLDAGNKPGDQFISLLAAELVDIMGAAQAPLTRRSDGRPNVILLSGLQGAGKTTAAGKLCSWALTQGYSKKILLVAADIYRPAAVEQLQTLGARLGIDVFHEKDISPVQISRKALSQAIANKYDTVIIDTAGRQVVDDRLMDELKQIKAAVSPDETLLVVDAMTGQEAATLTARFNDDIGITGAILTKMDGDTRGGAALSVRGVSGKPIKFVGVGEGMEDLEPFYPDRMASRILGMGDIQSLLEKAKSAIDVDSMTKATRKMSKGDFDFNDFALQAQTVRKMGGINGMLQMMPGMAGKVNTDQQFEMEKKFKTIDTIIAAMSEEERSNPDLLLVMGGKQEIVRQAAQRRVDLAARSNMTTAEIDAFLFEFSNMRKMMKANMKGVDLDALESNDPNKPMQFSTAKESKKAKKAKPSRGGGMGFGGK